MMEVVKSILATGPGAPPNGPLQVFLPRVSRRITHPCVARLHFFHPAPGDHPSSTVIEAIGCEDNASHVQKDCDVWGLVVKGLGLRGNPRASVSGLRPPISPGKGG